MRNEIKDELTTLRIKAKENRKKKACNSLIIVALAVVFYLISYFEPQLSGFFVLFLVTTALGGFYIFVDAIPSLIQPLPPISQAFKKIVSAIDWLENSKIDLAYKEAYSCLKQAHKILSDIELDELEWYEDVNQTVEQFIENLQLVVLPATEKSKIRKEDLEEIAVALSSMDVSKLAQMNKSLETQPDYEKVKPSPQKTEIYLKKLKENMPVRLLFANIISFLVVLVPIWLHSMIFQNIFADYFSNIMNFLTFLGIVIGLGALIYGIIKRKKHNS